MHRLSHLEEGALLFAAVVHDEDDEEQQHAKVIIHLRSHVRYDKY
jgi:hypothetical protein